MGTGVSRGNRLWEGEVGTLCCVVHRRGGGSRRLSSGGMWVLLTHCSNNVPDVYRWGQVVCIIDLEPNMKVKCQSQLMAFREHPDFEVPHAASPGAQNHPGQR